MTTDTGHWCGPDCKAHPFIEGNTVFPLRQAIVKKTRIAFDPMLVWFIAAAAILTTGIDFATKATWLPSLLIGIGLGAFASGIATIERRTR